MQVIYGPGNASNIALTAQKRLVRPVYAQTQGFPYAAILDPSLRTSTGTIRAPLNGDAGASAVNPFSAARTANAFTLQNSLIPGLVVAKTSSEYVAIHNGDTTATSPQPMGLLGQWLGGTFDNVGQQNQVGVWMGPDSVYELLAPAYDDTSIGARVAAVGSTGLQIPLYAGTDGRLFYTAAPGSLVQVARLIDRPSSTRILVQLVI